MLPIGLALGQVSGKGKEGWGWGQWCAFRDTLAFSSQLDSLMEEGLDQDT